MKTFFAIALRATLVLPLVACWVMGCSEDERPEPRQNPDDGTFRMADTAGVDLDLPSGSIYADPVSGLTLVFPEGASGRLVRGEILEGPDRPWDGGRGVYLSYDGDEAVQVRLAHAQGACELVLGYGLPHGSYAEGLRTRWFALPLADTLRTSAGDSLLVWLGIPESPAGGSCQGGVGHWFFEFPSGSALAETLAAASRAARPLIAAWLDSLSPATRAACEARIAGDLAPRFYPDGVYYSGFARPCAGGRTPAARVGIGDAPSRARLARQLGHYFTHLLMGDERYAELEGNAPFDPGLGRHQSERHGLINDFAYLHEHLLTGGIAGAGDPAEPSLFFLPAIAAPDPAETDVPALEGYGVLLMHALMRREASMTNLLGEEIEVPIVGWDYAQLADGVIAAGATDVDELREAIASRLALTGDEDRLAVLAAATGWIYAAATTVIDTSGAPIMGATVRNVLDVAGHEYSGAGQQQSGWDGRVRIDGLFPGGSMLRVATELESFDARLNIDWERATPAVLKLAYLAPWRELDRLTKLRIVLQLAVAPGGDPAGPTQTLRATLTLYDTDLDFSAEEIRRESAYHFPCDPQDLKDCWVVDSLRVAYSLETGQVSELRFRLANERYPPMALRLRSRPGLFASMAGCNQVFFARLSGADAERVGEAVSLEMTDSLGVSYTETDLLGANNAVEVYAYRG